MRDPRISEMMGKKNEEVKHRIAYQTEGKRAKKEAERNAKAATEEFPGESEGKDWRQGDKSREEKADGN